MKFVIRKPELYAEPKAKAATPLWVRGLLMFTSAGVSFAHGSNDGQKGMGLIMLILIGTVSTAYALNRTPSAGGVPSFVLNFGGRLQGRRSQGGGLQRPRRSAPGSHQLFDFASNQ